MLVADFRGDRGRADRSPMFPSWPHSDRGQRYGRDQVPEAHIEALIAFVDFRVHWALETDEAVTWGT